jgi:hypothetical protein
MLELQQQYSVVIVELKIRRYFGWEMLLPLSVYFTLNYSYSLTIKTFWQLILLLLYKEFCLLGHNAV